MELKSLPTEGRNPLTADIDSLPTEEMVRLVNALDSGVAGAVEREAGNIARAVDAIAKAMAAGGRLVYIGAGTSGRLGVLDASECPPTFGVPEGMVTALIAGGERALRHAVEGAEDDYDMGAHDLKIIGFGERDVLVGISASGRTPYVLGAMALARELGAVTVSVTCCPGSPMAEAARIAITPVTGAEAVTGSTRLKAGTAQKMVLNMLSTGAMIKHGKVYGNLMVDVSATNEKLKDRARRIVTEAAGVPADAASEALIQARGHAKTAICMLRTGLGCEEARALLEQCCGRLSLALEVQAAKEARP